MGRILVLADQYDHFTYWCSIQEPKENPKDRKFTVITPDTMRRGEHGFHRQEGDRFIRINSAPYSWPGRYEKDTSRPDVEGARVYINGSDLLCSILAPGGWHLEQAERHRT